MSGTRKKRGKKVAKKVKPDLTFGKYVAHLRTLNKHSLEKVAKKVYGSKTHSFSIQDLESGVAPSNAVIEKYSELYNVSPNYLYFLADRYPPDVRKDFVYQHDLDIAMWLVRRECTYTIDIIDRKKTKKKKRK